MNNAKVKRLIEDAACMWGTADADEMAIYIGGLEVDAGRLRAAAVSVVKAWDDDVIGQVDGGLIDDLRAAAKLPT